MNMTLPGSGILNGLFRVGTGSYNGRANQSLSRAGTAALRCFLASSGPSTGRSSPFAQPLLEVSEMQAYCLKCRAHTDINNAQQVTLKNGRPATRGKCSVCGSTVFRIGKAS